MQHLGWAILDGQVRGGGAGQPGLLQVPALLGRQRQPPERLGASTPRSHAGRVASAPAPPPRLPACLVGCLKHPPCRLPATVPAAKPPRQRRPR
jgi:hypothetical protein